MGYDRLDRINEEVRKALDQIIRGELNDPRIGGTFSIPSAEVTRDLKYCKVRVSILEEERRADFMKAAQERARLHPARAGAASGIAQHARTFVRIGPEHGIRRAHSGDSQGG